MRTFAAPQSRISASSRLSCADARQRIPRRYSSFRRTHCGAVTIPSRRPTRDTEIPGPPTKARAHQKLKKQEPAPVAQTPPPPPMPDWPINDKPSPASVVWDATGLRINASNSSLQQILSEVSTETGTKVEGLSADQRVYGEYGPGKARDVLSQLLQGSGYNVLLAGDHRPGRPARTRSQSAQSTAPSGAPQYRHESPPARIRRRCSRAA